MKEYYVNSLEECLEDYLKVESDQNSNIKRKPIEDRSKDGSLEGIHRGSS